MRRRKIVGALEDFLSFEQYAVLDDEKAHDTMIDFAGNTALNIEVGTGRGGFITAMAKRHPDKKFVGIELREEMLIKAVRRAEKEQVSNLKFIRGYAEHMVEWFENMTIDTVYLNFVDPWPKARHAKRRLSHSNYLNIYKQFMTIGSKIILKTDSPSLYAFSLEALESHFTIISHTDDLYSLGDQDNIPTEYELRYVERGLHIHRIVCQYEV